MNARSPSDGAKGSSLRTRLREATSAAILDAAEEVFADKGLNAAHMNDIAARAGVAVGTLYNHFKDRDALLETLLNDRRAGLLEVMDEFLDQPSSGDFRADLRELVHRMGGYLEQHQRFHQLLHQIDMGQSLAAYPATAASAPQMKREMYVRLEKLIKRGLKQKALRPELQPYYPGLLMGILRSMRMHMSETGTHDHMPLDEVVRFFMEGARA
jgi:AcrR family transcriptional regulator